MVEKTLNIRKKNLKINGLHEKYSRLDLFRMMRGDCARRAYCQGKAILLDVSDCSRPVIEGKRSPRSASVSSRLRRTFV